MLFLFISHIHSLTCSQHQFCLSLKVDESLRSYKLRWYYYTGYDQGGLPIDFTDAGYYYDFDDENTQHAESDEQYYYALGIFCGGTKFNYAKFDIVGSKGRFAEYTLTPTDIYNACPDDCPSNSYCLSLVNSYELKGHYNFYWYEDGVEKQQYSFDESKLMVTTNPNALIQVYVQGGECKTKTLIEKVTLPSNAGDVNTAYLWPSWLYNLCLPDYCPNNYYCTKLSIPSQYQNYQFTWYSNGLKLIDYDFNNFSTQWAGEFEADPYHIYVMGGKCNTETFVKKLDVDFASFKEYSLTESDLSMCAETTSKSKSKSSHKAGIIVGVIFGTLAVCVIAFAIIIYLRKRQAFNDDLSPSPLLNLK